MGAALVINAILSLICAGACVLIFIFIVHVAEAIDRIECYMDETNGHLEDIRFRLSMDGFNRNRHSKEKKEKTNGVH